MIHSSIFNSLMIKSCLMPLFLLIPYSSWAADTDNCTIKGTISFTGIPYWGNDNQIFWFKQVTGVNSYNGGALNVGIDSTLNLLGHAVTPPSSLTTDEVKSLFQNMMSDTTWTRRVLVYSNTSTPTSPNTALITSPFTIIDNFSDIIDGGNISINKSSVGIINAPKYYDSMPYFTYLYGIRLDTTGIPTVKNATKLVDYPLSSAICSIPTGTIDTTYQLTLKYSLSNQNSGMSFMPSYGGSAPSVNDSYQLHAKVSFTRQLNLSIATVPGALSFGQIPNTIPSEKDIKISIKGVPVNSSVQVSYQLSGAPSWAGISIVNGLTDVTSALENINAGEIIDRKVRIQPTVGSTGDIDARLTINVSLN